MSAALAIWTAPPWNGLGMTDTVKKSLLSACRRMLHPLVRIVLRNGLSYGEFADTVRGAFIDIAAAELVQPGRPQSDARVGMLTGMSAREVARVRAETPFDESGVDANTVARVLQGWSQDPEFLGPYGLPLEVPFSGDRISFETLVARYAEGASARDLLDRLIRVNAAFETDDGYCRLLNRTYVPTPLDPIGIERLGTTVGYFIDTVDFNLQKTREGGGRFERYAITMQGLSPANFAAFDELVRQKGQEFLEALDDWLGEHEIKGDHTLSPGECIRTGVSVFHFIDRPSLPMAGDG